MCGIKTPVGEVVSLSPSQRERLDLAAESIAAVIDHAIRPRDGKKLRYLKGRVTRILEGWGFTCDTPSSTPLVYDYTDTEWAPKSSSPGAFDNFGRASLIRRVWETDIGASEVERSA